jgi:exonuclease SbcD
MRLAHTSDWHAGRVFKQVKRLPELQQALEGLADDLEREKVDVLLHSGDVFDSGAPAPEAEQAVFSFFKRVGRAGIRTVVIAGNHDSAPRLEAWGSLAELVGVSVVSRPRPVDAGGVVEVASRDGREVAKVAAMPFAPARWFVSALELAEGRVDEQTGLRLDGDVAARQGYAQSMADLAAHLGGSFRPDTVNVLMSHTHLVGAKYSGSERGVHLGEEWAALPQSLPSAAHYVALGHIHRAQRISSVAAPAEYAGSPLQMDFGETGEDKSWVLVDARPGQPAAVEHVTYRGGRRLEHVRMDLPTLEREASRMRAEDTLLWVTVPLSTPDPELNSRVRHLLPGAVRVEAELPGGLPAADLLRPAGAAPRELFAAYCRRQQREAGAALLAEFDRLLHDCEHAG